MVELEPLSFFPGETLPLVAEQETVFAILDALTGYIRSVLRPNAPLVGLVDRPLAFVDGRWLDTGFTLSENGVVEVGGVSRPDAVLVQAGAFFRDGSIELGQGSVVESGAYLAGPTVVGPGCQVRQGAYVRGACLFQADCVIGHATEVKHSLFLEGAKAGHFAYVGDSVLGREVNLGAGTKLANLRFDGRDVKVDIGGRVVETGRRKLGAILGNRVQTGCNSVTNPGTLVPSGGRVPGCAAVGPGLYGVD